MALKKINDFPAWPPSNVQTILDASSCHLDNAGQLKRDRSLFGTTFVDATGKRIDPSTIRPYDG